MDKKELLEILKYYVVNADCELNFDGIRGDELDFIQGFDFKQDDDENYLDLGEIFAKEEYNKIKKCYDRAKEALDDLRNVIDDLLEEQE